MSIRPTRTLCSAILVVLWFISLLLSAWPGAGQLAPVAAGVQFLFLLLFALLHASMMVGWRGASSFFAIGIAVGFAMEATSIAGGIPFGFFVHNVPLPKLLGVPPHVPVAYAVLGWLAWNVAIVLVRWDPSVAQRTDRWLAPAVAALILTGYDFAYDAIGSTVNGAWTYRYPSGQFGVPYSNFVGWFLTGWTIFQIWALVLPRFQPPPSSRPSRLHWLMPPIIWAATTLQYPLLYVGAPGGSVAIGGRVFIIADIFEAAMISAGVTMLPVAFAALARLLVAPETVTSPR